MPMSPRYLAASPSGRYGIAVLATALALGLQRLAWPFMSTSPFLFFYLAVMFAGWWGGWGPAVLSIGLSVLAIDGFFLAPEHSFRVTPGDGVALSVFVVLSLLMTRLNTTLRRTNQEREALLERERLARATSEAEQARFHALLMQAPAIVARFQGPEHTFTLSNPLSTALFGQRELLGKPLREAVPEAVPQGLPALLDRVYATGAPYTGRETPWTFLQEGGETKAFFLDLVLQPTRDVHGHIDGVACFAFDRSEPVLARQRMQELNAQLKRSKEQYQDFVSQSTEGIFRVETRPLPVNLPEDAQVDAMLEHSFIAECNDAMARMYGQERAEALTGTRLSRLLVPEDPHNREYLKAFIRGGYQLESAESHEVTREGQPRVFLNNLAGVIEAGHLVSVWGIQRDVTEQRRAEEALRHGEERLRIAVTAAAIGTWDMGLVTGGYQCDARGRQLFGLSPDAALHLESLRAGVHPEDRGRFEQALAGAFTPSGGGDFRIEYRTPGAQGGAERWVAVHGRVFFDEQARPVRFTGTVLDVSEQRRAEANARFLAEAGAVLSSSLDYEATLRNVARLTVPELADWCLVDMRQPDGTFRRVEVTTASPEEAELARLVQHYTLDPERSAAHPALQAFLQQQPLLVEQLAPEGFRAAAQDEEHTQLMRTIHPRSFIAVPLVVRGQAFGVLSFFTTRSGRRYTAKDRDFLGELAHRVALSVENARLYREAQEAIQLRDEFLSIASHELKTPLTPLSLKLQMLSREVKRQPDSPLRRSVEDYLVIGMRQVKKLSELVSDLLDVTRIAGGRLRLEPEPVQLDTLIREVAGRYEAEAARVGSSLRLDLQESVVGHWDRLRLEQVVTNLVDNAIKYGAGKPIHVGLQLREHQAWLHVRDEGIGIAPQALSRIFGRFERAVSERHYGGLGLGLYITRTIVEALGGSIQAQSALGEGATFTVTLPVAPPQAPEAPGPSAQDSSVEPSAAGSFTRDT
ncbi:PAS domain S-box-containing protein [Stigmatella aurantiaca]|uniref:histidine kinase n=1 Tax=Stigmatella aurantiaca TaxID=41 RepID=A0A1H7NN10_STIAU|nr:ATP-binding protein [Stigmatella aurantiaca]SEL24826.1 PAS domain S-box-containing protein [Stigmatella aurantiaca]